MTHIADGLLRRLDDEPLAVPDKVADHVAGCARCRARRSEIAQDTARTAALFATAQLSGDDTELAWARIQRELYRGPRAGGERRVAYPRRWPARVTPRLSLRAGLALASVGALVAGTAAAATFTTVFAPTHVTPVTVSRGDMRALDVFMGLADGHGLGFSAPRGSSTLRFGTVTWSTPPAHNVSSLAQARAQVGLAATLPSRLPAGVGAVTQLTVQPRLSATVTFNSSTGGLAGHAVTLDAGPAVFAQYGGAQGRGLPTLAVLTLLRPTAVSTGASLAEIESFLLTRPGIPPALAEEIRLLGASPTALPVPVPAGAHERAVRVNGAPAVLLADSSGAAAGVIWEDGGGMLHIVAGLLDSQDVLDVAAQLG